MFVILFTIKASQGLYLVIIKIVDCFGLIKFIDDCFYIIYNKYKNKKGEKQYEEC